MPRPKLKPELQRNHVVQVKFTAAEIQQLDVRRERKQSRAGLLRECFFKRYGDTTARRLPTGGSK